MSEKKVKCYYQGRWFNNTKEFNEWVEEYSSARASNCLT